MASGVRAERTLRGECCMYVDDAAIVSRSLTGLSIELTTMMPGTVRTCEQFDLAASEEKTKAMCAYSYVVCASYARKSMV